MKQRNQKEVAQEKNNMDSESFTPITNYLCYKDYQHYKKGNYYEFDYTDIHKIHGAENFLKHFTTIF